MTRCACVDIGSNTTRLLVAEPDGPRLSEVVAERSFTRIGAACGEDRVIPAAKLAEVATVVASQVAVSRAAGAQRLRVVATAAIRDAPNRDELCAVVRDAAGVEVEVLSSADEGRLAFLGATGSCHGEIGDQVDQARATRSVAVVDVGGGSTEIVVGTPAAGVTWVVSVPLGSSSLLPPSTGDESLLTAGAPARARSRVEAAFAGITPPAVERAVVVGGSATSVALLVGEELSSAALARALDLLTGSTVAEIAKRHDLHPQRVQMLPGALLLLAAASQTLNGASLEVGRGGLREGVVLELLAQA